MFSDESGNAIVRDNLFFSQDLTSLIFPTSLNDYIIPPTISGPQLAPSLSTVEPWLTQLNQSTVSDLSAPPIDKCPSPNRLPLHSLSQSTVPPNPLLSSEVDRAKSQRISTTRTSRKRPSTDAWVDTTFTKRRNKKAKSEYDTEVEKKSQEREELLARNRVAASKSRQKKKEFVTELEERSRDLAEQNKVLHVAVSTLKNEMLDLKDKCLRHMNCECEGIRQYLARSVMRKCSIVPTAALDNHNWDQQLDEVLRASETSNTSDVTASTTEVTPSMDSSSIPSPRPTMKPDMQMLTTLDKTCPVASSIGLT